MIYKLFLSKQARKQFDRLPKEIYPRVEKAIDELLMDPFRGKKLEGEHDGYWSVRVWPYRIIYTIEKHIVTVTVVAIGQRKDVYRRLR